MNSVIRQSNIELLRILAMLFVLIGHANGVVLGLPVMEDFQDDPLGSFCRILFTSLPVGGVNIFILISGWFGIHATKKGAAKFLFQVLFLLWGIYLVSILLGKEKLSAEGIKVCMGLTNEYWFVMGYLGLYILSPLLNSFVNSSSKIVFRNFLIAFYAFQCYYSWITGVVSYFEGYSIIFFCGLYLTGRYFNLYPVAFISNKPLRVYFLISILLAIVSFCTLYQWGNAMKLLRYDNPLVILSSVSLLVYFSRMKTSSSFVNWLAASSFAVYIVHFHPSVFPLFRQMVEYLSIRWSGGVFVFFILIFLLITYFVCVLIDQIRIVAWKMIAKL